MNARELLLRSVQGSLQRIAEYAVAAPEDKLADLADSLEKSARYIEGRQKAAAYEANGHG